MTDDVIMNFLNVIDFVLLNILFVRNIIEVSGSLLSRMKNQYEYSTSKDTVELLSTEALYDFEFPSQIHSTYQTDFELYSLTREHTSFDSYDSYNHNVYERSSASESFEKLFRNFPKFTMMLPTTRKRTQRKNTWATHFPPKVRKPSDLGTSKNIYFRQIFRKTANVILLIFNKSTKVPFKK